MKYPVIFKTFSVLFSLQSDERWIVPIFGGTIILPASVLSCGCGLFSPQPAPYARVLRSLRGIP